MESELGSDNKLQAGIKLYNLLTINIEAAYDP